MGTRGSYGFRAAGEDRLAHNQFDSYPSGLGAAIADDIQRRLLKSPPTVEQVLTIELLPLTDERADIHAAFKQGPLSTLLTRQRPRFASGNLFVGDSLFCEWAYVFNLDTGKLEVYRGFQRTPGVGRYAHLNLNPDHEPTYYGVSLVAELPLAEATPEAMLRLDQVVSREETNRGEERRVFRRGVDIDDALAQRSRFAPGNRFASDSPFYEWTYEFNLDTGTLEVYRGFQRRPRRRGQGGADDKEGKDD